MALLQTQLLPNNITQPRLPRKPPVNAPVQVLQAYISIMHDYFHQQQTMVQGMYNSIVQANAAQTLAGLDADLPAAGQPGRTFIATDTKLLYLDTGSAWLKATLA